MMLRDRLTAAGVRLAALPDGGLRAAGNLTDDLRAFVREHRAGLLAELAAANDEASHRWRVTTPAGASVEVWITPEATADDVRAIYPGATLEPLPDAPKRQATPAEAAELHRLIATLLADADDAERAEALRVALADPEASLSSFRALVAEVQPNDMPCLTHRIR